jgi:hypothetical protein
MDNYHTAGEAFLDYKDGVLRQEKEFRKNND